MIELKKKPKNVTIIEGFPGFGLVGTIASEFLIDHVKTELIGKMWFEELPAMIAIHKEKIVEPIGISYSSRYNLVFVHAVTAVPGLEWKLADEVIKLANDMKAKEIICLEGVGSSLPGEKPKAYFYSSDEKKKELLKSIAEPLREGIIMGVTSAVMLNANLPVTCIFAEAHTDLPDSKAAAKIIEVLDKYIGLKVDYKPLIDTAKKFEEKLRTLLEQGQTAQVQKDKKMMSYVG